MLDDKKVVLYGDPPQDVIDAVVNAIAYVIQTRGFEQLKLPHIAIVEGSVNHPDGPKAAVYKTGSTSEEDCTIFVSAENLQSSVAPNLASSEEKVPDSVLAAFHAAEMAIFHVYYQASEGKLEEIYRRAMLADAGSVARSVVSKFFPNYSKLFQSLS